MAVLIATQAILFPWSLKDAHAQEQETARVVRDTALWALPSHNAAKIGTLSKNTTLGVTGRQGPWMSIQTEDPPRKGWVHLLSLSFNFSGNKKLADMQGKKQILEVARAGNIRTAHDTGRRGIQEDDLKTAQPDFNAVRAMKKLAILPAEAREFSKKAGLRADSDIKHLRANRIPFRKNKTIE